MKIMMINEQHQKYDLSCEFDALDFLKTHPQLLPVLLETIQQLRKCYFNNIELNFHLECFFDDENIKLSLIVICGLDIQSVLSRLQSFDYDYWLKVDRSIRDLMMVDVSCQR